MAYTKQTWVDGTTPIDAEHMNHIEDGIESVDSKCEYVYMDETTVMTRQYVKDLLDKFDNGVKLIGVTPDINGYIYSKSVHKYRSGVEGQRYIVSFKYLTEYLDIGGDTQFGYKTMCVSWSNADSPATEYTWITEYEPIVSVSDANNMALVVSTELEGENYTFNETWQNIHDKNYTTVIINSPNGIVYACPIVRFGHGDNGLYYVDFLTYTTGSATVKQAWAESEDGYPSWNARD